MLIPAVLVTLGLATGMTPQQKTVKGKVIFSDTGEIAAGASVIIAGTTMGTVVDHDGTFMLNVDGKVIKDIDEVDPETIEQIDVIKDPDTEIAKQYNAKQGVVLITTKQGNNAKGKKNQQEVKVIGYA